MGFMGTILGFGAGYALGAKGAPHRSNRSRSRSGDAVAPTLAGSAASRRNADTRMVRDMMTPLPETVRQRRRSRTRPGSWPTRQSATCSSSSQIAIASWGSSRTAIWRSVRSAKGLGPFTKVEEIASRDLVAVSPTASAHEALDLMKGLNVRRLPVVEDDRPIGVVARVSSNYAEAGSALADISAASPDH